MSSHRCGGTVEYNIEGDPRPELDRARARRQAGSMHARARDARRDHESGGMVRSSTPHGELQESIDRLKAAGVRISLFVDAEASAIEWAKILAPIASSSTPNRLREPSSAVPRRRRPASRRYVEAAQRAHAHRRLASTPGTIWTCAI